VKWKDLSEIILKIILFQIKDTSKDTHILDIENKLSSQLGTKVSIDTRKNGRKGKIIIEFLFA